MADNNSKPQNKTKGEENTWHKTLINKSEKSFDTQKQILEDYFHEIGKKAQTCKMVKAEVVEEDVQIRIKYKNYPFKIYCLTHYSYDLEIYVKTGISKTLEKIIRNRETNIFNPWNLLNFSLLDINGADAVFEHTGVYTLMRIERDPDKIPEKKDSSDPWASEDSDRVFLANGIFIEGKGIEFENSMVLYNYIPENLQKELSKVFEENRINSLQLQLNGDIIIKINQDNLLESKKPISLIFTTLDFLVKFAVEMENIYIPEKVEEKNDDNLIVEFPTSNDYISRDELTDNNLSIVKCEYCTSRYLLTVELKCPNCGASYSP